MWSAPGRIRWCRYRSTTHQALFAALRQNRVLPYDQANEVVEQALLALETLQSKGEPAVHL